MAGLLVLGLAAAAPAPAGAEITLTYSNFFPPTHIQSKLAESWCQEVAKRTGGEVKVQYFPGQTLTKARQVYDGVVQGMSDVGMALFGYTRGRFPLMEAVDLPLGYTSGKVATQVANAFYQKFQPKELSDTQVMYLTAHGPGILHTKRTPVKSMADLKGLKIRSHGTTAKLVKALGGTAVAMPMPELYQSLQKGVVDGAFYPVEVNKGWKMAEVVDYMTRNDAVAYTATFFVVMNKDKWASIPAKHQKTIQEINQEWIAKHGEAWDSSDQAGREYFLAKGGKILELGPEESARWVEAVSPVIEEYAQEMETKGLPGKEAVAFVKAKIAELGG
jgi:TRAP-type C4-dicarboxylate transport system substrate-binding protein